MGGTDRHCRGAAHRGLPGITPMIGFTKETSVEVVKDQSHAELVKRVADIAPVLRANAQWGDQHQRLADEVVDAMIGAGVLRMLVPAYYGGYESDMETGVDVGLRLRRG